MRKPARLIIFFLAITILFTAAVFAQSSPWEPYKEYIPEEAPAVKRHFRAAWIASVSNLDWPSAETSKIVDDAERIAKTKEELILLLDKAVEMKLNAVFLQVSPTADAFYKSEILHWSRYLTCTAGKDPGFDPLQFAIEEAHARNLELHAWLNPYRVSMDMKPETIASLNIPKSIYKEQPGWVMTAGGRFVLDPGIPEVRQWVVDRVLEVVRNYDVDGIHFDDYFYTFTEIEISQNKDQATYVKYNGGKFANISDWRRNNTYLLIKQVNDDVRNEKPWVKFGVSPIAIWENQSSAFPEGSKTVTSFTSYSRMFADTKKWVEDEILDYIAPQIYFTFGNTRAPYGELADWWARVCAGKKVHLYIGQALYKVNADTDPYFRGDNALTEFRAQLSYNSLRGGIMGSIMFRMANFDQESIARVTDYIKSDFWKYPALVPVMNWKGGTIPQKPAEGLLDKTAGGIKISWNDSDPSTAYFAVYRYEKYEEININTSASAKRLIGTVRKKQGARQEYTDIGATDTAGAVYVITALDRLHNESGWLEISTDQSKYFYDVGSKQSWAVYSIDYLRRFNIVAGVKEGYYGPDMNTRRADYIIMLTRTFNLKADIVGTYSDVPADAYYANQVGIAKTLGITPDEETFRPLEYITREDMFVYMLRVLEYKGMNIPEADMTVLEVFTDRDNISAYAREAAARLTKAGLMAGSGGKVNPKACSTRAEIAAVLFRMISTIGSGAFR